MRYTLPPSSISTSRGALIATLISTCTLIGCQSTTDSIGQYYKPTSTGESVAAHARTSSPQLVRSNDPDKDGGLLRRDGYVLIGPASFNGAPDLSDADRAVIVQGQKVGASIVLLKARAFSQSTSCCRLDESLQMISKGGASYFSSYWAKPDPVRTQGGIDSR